MYTPDATIVHIREASSSQCAAGMHVLQRRSMLMFLEKRSGKIVRRIANAMFCVCSALRLSLLALLRLWSGTRGESARRKFGPTASALRFHLTGHVPN